MATLSSFSNFSIFEHMQKQLSENVFIDERRPVLLCDGKLCLRALQDLFNLAIVEMMYGMCNQVHEQNNVLFSLQTLHHFQDFTAVSLML